MTYEPPAGHPLDSTLGHAQHSHRLSRGQRRPVRHEHLRRELLAILFGKPAGP